MKKLIPLLIFATIFTGCLDGTNNSDCNPVDESFFLEEHALKDGVVELDSGLLYRILEEGDGEIPTEDQVVFINFSLNLITGGSPIASTSDLTFFTLNEALPGLREGISIMTEGSTYEFVIPTELAYNNDPPPGTSIRCGSVLIYEVTLDSFLRDVDVFLSENEAREDVDIKVTESGLQYRVIEEGEGDFADSTNTVSVFYEGRLTNDYVFDPGTDDKTAEFSVSGVIDGFSEGLQLMKVGSRYEFFIPPNLAYGDNPPRVPRGDPNGRLVLPPNAILVFEVELVAIAEGS